MATLVLALLGTGLALAAEGEQGSEDALRSGASPALAVELPATRTATSRTFELPDGIRETRLYQAPVNFRDEDGKWRPIEEGLNGRDGAALSNGDNSFDLVLPARLGSGPVRLSNDRGWVASRLLGAPSASVDLEKDGTAKYQLADPDASIELSTLANGIKENIEIASPSSPSAFRFELTASAGVTPTAAKDGSIAFRDQADDLVAQLPAPFMFDDSGTPDGFSTDVEYELSPKDSGGWLLTVAASRKWLEDPSRVWPITIDPSIFGPRPAYFDCTIYSAPTIETWNKCGQKGVPVLAAEDYNRPSTPDEYSRTLAFFRLIGAIPTTVDVTSAEMHLYSGEAAQNTDGVELTRLTVPWSSYVSWKYSGYPNCYTCAPWATPGGTGAQVVGQVSTADRGGSAAGWWDIPLQEKMVQEWITGGEPVNFGVAVKQLGEQAHSCTPSCLYRKLLFESSAASTSSRRPYLGITYFPQAPATSKVTAPSDGTRTAKRLKLQAGWNNGVTGVTWQYREGKEGPFQDVPLGLVRDGECNAVAKWPVATKVGQTTSVPLYLDASQLTPNLRKKGGPVQIRALFEGGAYGVSVPTEATIDPALGGPKDATAEVGPGSVNLLTGNFTVTKTDVSIPTFNSSLDFSRTFSSRDAGKPGDKGVLGQGWKPGVPVEENGAGAWRSIELVTENEVYEGFNFSFTYAKAIGIEGAEVPFEQEESGAYKTPDVLAGWSLTAPSASQFVLRTPDGTKTTFTSNGSGSVYLPSEVSQPGASSNSTRMVYEVKEGNRRLTQVVAPTVPGIDCVTKPTATAGCKVLTFNYMNHPSWGGERLAGITYHASAMGGPWAVASYDYDDDGRLIAAWDPRISPNLKETYAYESTGQIKTITPAGLKPWTMEYGTLNEEEVSGRLMAVKRDSLVPSDPVARTTIAYGVPASGSGSPYPMSGADVGKWGQKDAPVDATAIFPPDQVPTSTPPSTYSRATVYYMDSDGYSVNTATPSGAGTEAASISTNETDQYGNVVRELTPRNRIRALAQGSESVTLSEQLDTQRSYADKGTEMVEEVGPLHDVRLEGTGEVVPARSYRYVEYDQVTGGAKLPKLAPHLPTTEKTAAWVEGELRDPRVNKTQYNWKLRKPTKAIIDAGTEPDDLNIESVTSYDSQTGLPRQIRQPSDAESAGAGTTKFTYYTLGSASMECKNYALVGLPCLIEPAAQPGTSGMPQVKATRIAVYNHLGQPMDVWEGPGKAALDAQAPLRQTITTYDSAGRMQTVQRTGGGTTVPKVELEYSSSTGAPTTQRFDCSTGGCEGSDEQEVTSVYDSLGRITEYTDADANASEVTYDLLGRPVTTDDGKGTQTRTYDPDSGLLTKLEDSAAGTFTASYDADGNLLAEGLPNGLLAESTYDEAGQLTGLTYDKAGSAWLDFDAERSISGQILSQKSLTSRQEYSYDKAGRLVKTKDWDAPTGGNCTTREYVFGEPGYEALPGKNSNRTRMMTRPSGVAGACTTTGGSEQKYEYDAADRLINEGIAYDDFGRITSLSGVFAGGKALSTSYFTTDMVASQTQDGVTNTFQLDAGLRQRQRTQGGGLEGVEVFHYADGSDTPAWTQFGSKWSRNIPGIGGGIAAIQDSSSETLLQLSNLHGDVVATATLSPSATKPVATFEHDEFGMPKLGGAPQFGWLGSKGRRTEFPSGVIQMGVRSYVPAMGRFLTPDPVLGGSANAYEYASQDPVNNFDLAGTVCQGGSSRAAKDCRRARKRARRFERAARRANRRGAIVTTFKNRAAATRFMRYLNSNPLYLENIRRQESEWKAAEMKRLQERAKMAAGIEAQYDEKANGGACAWISYGASGLGIAFAPPTGGASLWIVGVFGFSTGTGDVTGLC